MRKLNDPRAVEGLRRWERIRDTCTVCGRTKQQIVSDVRQMQAMGVMVLNHDMLGYCSKCGVTYCSNHFNYYGKTCRKCGGEVEVLSTSDWFQ